MSESPTSSPLSDLEQMVHPDSSELTYCKIQPNLHSPLAGILPPASLAISGALYSSLLVLKLGSLSCPQHLRTSVRRGSTLGQLPCALFLTDTFIRFLDQIHSNPPSSIAQPLPRGCMTTHGRISSLNPDPLPCERESRFQGLPDSLLLQSEKSEAPILTKGQPPFKPTLTKPNPNNNVGRIHHSPELIT